MMPGPFELIIILFIISIYAIPIILHYRQKRVVLKHKTLQTIKEVPFLYSWTSAVFGFLTPLLRGDIKWFFIYLIVGVPTYNLGAVALSFFYNKNYITSRLPHFFFKTPARTGFVKKQGHYIRHFSKI